MRDTVMETGPKTWGSSNALAEVLAVQVLFYCYITVIEITFSYQILNWEKDSRGWRHLPGTQALNVKPVWLGQKFNHSAFLTKG